MLSVFKYRAWRMNAGKTLFAQVMEFVPWTSFSRIVDRHHGDAGVSELSCADVFRAMAFAQLGVISVFVLFVALGLQKLTGGRCQRAGRMHARLF